MEVLIVGSLFCPVGAATVLCLRRAAAEFGDRVVIKEVPTGPEALPRYGVADGIFINLALAKLVQEGKVCAVEIWEGGLRF